MLTEEHKNNIRIGLKKAYKEGRRPTGNTKPNSGSFKKGRVSEKKGKTDVYSDDTLEKMSKAKLGYTRTEDSKIRQKATIKKKQDAGEYVQPSGMLGKKQSPEFCELISKLHTGKVIPDSVRDKISTTLKDKYAIGEIENKAYNSNRYKKGFCVDLGHYTRSSWEADVGRYLKMMEVRYEYEPVTFKLVLEDGTNTSYRPDFYLTDYDLYIEVKGWIKNKHSLDNSKDEKVEAFRMQYPDKQILFLNREKYYEIFNPKKHNIFTVDFNTFLEKHFNNEKLILQKGI